MTKYVTVTDDHLDYHDDHTDVVNSLNTHKGFRPWDCAFTLRRVRDMTPGEVLRVNDTILIFRVTTIADFAL